MNALAKWFEENGSARRKELFLKIRERFPNFSQTSLSQYSKGKRIPDREVAEIIAAFCGLDLRQIPFRYIHKPDDSQDLRDADYP
jgi:hypothetical protein